MKLENRTQKIVLTGVLTALLCVLSIVSIPLPSGVPITLQTFAVALCGFVLGPVYGPVAVLAYLILGAVGLPVFAGMNSGLGVLAGVTGGYLWGFLPMALLCGLGARRENRALGIVLGVAGLACCHLCGSVWFALFTHRGPLEAFLLASAPYLIKDVISVVGAYLISVGVIFSLKKAGLVKA